MSIDRSTVTSKLPWRILIGLASVCLVTSSNYVINEVLDARVDAEHHTKRNRPVPAGQVSIPLAYLQWIALMLAGVGLGLTISVPFALVMAGLWLMGCVYNIAPIRTKDLPYLDVLSESINNPLRMLAGWCIAGASVLPPRSLLISYWMIGCYFMAIKRFAEYRDISDAARSKAYRKGPPLQVEAETASALRCPIGVRYTYQPWERGHPCQVGVGLEGSGRDACAPRFLLGEAGKDACAPRL